MVEGLIIVDKEGIIPSSLSIVN
ncbi:uncharacterized protein METZ01_LOCUS257915 [marine metagenome]|uniref:Uncharacterized protein n=1 Tax=marine metagenome TaxID=408172 RepID=A0A382J2K6_9ZZZZ